MTTESGMTNRPFYGFVNGENEYDPFEPVVTEEPVDTIFMEDLLHNLPQEQLKVLACRYLGFKSKETVNILHYKNRAKYYNVSTKLREICCERKMDNLTYN